MHIAGASRIDIRRREDGVPGGGGGEAEGVEEQQDVHAVEKLGRAADAFRPPQGRGGDRSGAHPRVQSRAAAAKQGRAQQAAGRVSGEVPYTIAPTRTTRACTRVKKTHTHTHTQRERERDKERERERERERREMFCISYQCRKVQRE